MDTIQQRLRALGDRVARSVGANRQEDSFRHLASEPLVAGAVPYGLEDMSQGSRVYVGNRVKPVSSREAYEAIAADRPTPSARRSPQSARRSAGDSVRVSSSSASPRLSASCPQATVANALEASQLGLDLLALPPSERDILLVDELAAIASATRAALEHSSDEQGLAAGVDALDLLNTVLDELRHQASSAGACSPQATGVPSPRQPATPRLGNQVEATAAVLDKPLIEL